MDRGAWWATIHGVANENKQVTDSELAIVREPATTISIWQTQRQAGQWESFRVKQSGVSVVMGGDCNHEKAGG